MKSTVRPEELFESDGRLKPELADLVPKGHRRMSDNPHTKGGLLLRDLRMPDFLDYEVKTPAPGATTAEATRVMGNWQWGGSEATKSAKADTAGDNV
jgi:xylulose-5-phosphate/fructose-6-phosphate phosphoketolase